MVNPNPGPTEPSAVDSGPQFITQGIKDHSIRIHLCLMNQTSTQAPSQYLPLPLVWVDSLFFFLLNITPLSNLLDSLNDSTLGT